MIEWTISTSGSTGTGLKKCSPITLCGCEVSAPSFMIGTEDVFDARNCASGSSSSSRRNMSRLSPSSSMIASIAASAPATSSKDVEKARRSRPRPSVLFGHVPAAHAAVQRPVIASRDRSQRSGSTSTTVTSTPDRAHTSAMPEPMNPPPITPTRMGGDAISRRRQPLGQERRLAPRRGGKLRSFRVDADDADAVGQLGRPWEHHAAGTTLGGGLPRDVRRPPRGRRPAAPRASRSRAHRCRSRRT